jgi:hypothetical protein
MFPKPARGTALLEKRDRRNEIRQHEKDEKAKVVRRDGSKVCRLVPHCPEREKFETAHLDDKGMGGDHGNRTSADTMIRSCFFHHQGIWSLHSHDLRVEYLTPEKANGPVEVWGRTEADGWYLVKRESSCGITERD